MLQLIQTDWGQFDLVIDDRGDTDANAAAATLVYAALFTDAEAPESRAARYDRRGWYADPKAGSGLWHLRRQPLNSNARREALAMVRTALTQRAPGLLDVAVQEAPADTPAGNISSVSLSVSGFHNGRKFIVRIPL